VTAVDVRHHFEEHAEHYAERVAPFFAITYEYLARWSTGLPSPARVLDVACGDGRVAAVLAAQRHQVIACDRSAPLLERAAGPRIRLLHADAHALPLRKGCVDAVVCNLGVQFFARPVVALREMGRVVVSGGPIVVTVPEKPSVRPQAPHAIVAQLNEAGLRMCDQLSLSVSVRVMDVTTLVAVWKVEMSTLRELAEGSESDLVELAQTLLDQDDGSITLPLKFSAYHCVAGHS